MFEPCPTPRGLALRLCCDFAAAFLAGLTHRMAGHPPEAWARITIYVNTRRAQRRLEGLLQAGNAMILPDIKVIGDLANDPTFPLPQTADPLTRQLLLADLVRAYLQNQPDLAPTSQMFDLANSLAELLDELDGEGLTVKALNNVVPDHLSGHWQRSLAFFEILNTYVTSLGQTVSGVELRHRAAVVYLAEKWAKNPPAGPIIIAGSTGSRTLTSMFMKLVASLPQGAVVLPGFDFEMPTDLWPDLGQEHPQFGFSNLGKVIGFDPSTVQKWSGAVVRNPARNALASLALRPAPITAAWLDEAPALVPDLSRSCGGLTLIEAPDPRTESIAIAHCLRQALEDGKTAALVTPDRTLARRVGAALQRWNILPDDSAGQPATLSPPGILLSMVAGVMGQQPDNLALIEILKHPLCAAGAGRAAHISLVRKMENDVLRGRHDVPWLIEKSPEVQGWMAWFNDIFLALETTENSTLGQWAALHIDATQRFVSGSNLDDFNALWDKEAGRVVQHVMSNLLAAGDHPACYSAAEYRALFASTLRAEEVRDDAVRSHPDIAIWGTLEARMNTADLVIMAGLNDGIWPKVSRNDTWLNRDIRNQIGLQLPERRIGLSAHDFQQGFAASEVVLSRSIRDGEAPTVASRWLMRLQNLLAGMGKAGENTLAEVRVRGEAIIDQARGLDTPVSPAIPALRPAPAPPVSARPIRLSVTQIETLIRDPYAIYARHVLRLNKLNMLVKTPDHLEKGNTLHRVLEAFVDATPTDLNDADAAFDTALDAVLDTVPWPAARRLWRSNFLRSKDYFITSEAARREVGQPFAREVKGQRALTENFTLTAKADRIDCANNTVSIYDYKSGNKPSERQIRQFDVQLPLEGAIALGGGFEGLPAPRLGQIQLIYLGADYGSVTFGDDDPVVCDVWENLGSLIARYSVETCGYPARLRPELIKFEADYDHLARRGEWQDDDGYVPEGVS